MSLTVARLGAADARRERSALAAILRQCVDGGASISFMAPLAAAEALAWADGVAASVAAGATILVGARLGGELVGSVQLGIDMPPNQPHRADLKKLIVSPGARGRGVGAALMAAIEAEAAAIGRTLLVLDTADDGGARLYRRGGWTEAGAIPGFALWPDGRPCDTVIFWKRV